jgi:hypothetical protein
MLPTWNNLENTMLSEMSQSHEKRQILHDSTVQNT